MSVVLGLLMISAAVAPSAQAVHEACGENSPEACEEEVRDEASPLLSKLFEILPDHEEVVGDAVKLVEAILDVIPDTEIPDVDKKIEKLWQTIRGVLQDARGEAYHLVDFAENTCKEIDSCSYAQDVAEDPEGAVPDCDVPGPWGIRDFLACVY